MAIGRLQPLEQFVVLEACLLGVIIWLPGLNLLHRISKFSFKVSWVNYYLSLCYSCFIYTQLTQALSTYVAISLISCNLGICIDNFYTREATQTWEQVVRHSTNHESISHKDGCKRKPRNQPPHSQPSVANLWLFWLSRMPCLQIRRHYFLTIIVHNFAIAVVVHIDKKAKKPNILNSIPNDIRSHSKINVAIDVTTTFCKEAKCQNTKNCDVFVQPEGLYLSHTINIHGCCLNQNKSSI